MTVATPRRMGPVLATLLVAGNMIGSGLYLLPVSLAPYGTSSVIGWIVTTVAALGLAGVFAILGRLRPEADGLQDYPRKALHPVAGLVAWAAYWVSCPLGNVAIALAAIGYLTSLVPGLSGPVPMVLALLAVIWGMTLVNLIGARTVARLGGAALVLGLIPVLAAIIVGLSALEPERFLAAWSPEHRSLLQTAPGMVLTMFWGFLGLECANAVAAKVRNPARDLPIAALGGVLLAGAVYLLASVAVQGVIPPGELARSTAPFADVVSRVLGPAVGAAIAVLAIIKTCGTLAGWILVTAEMTRAGVASGYFPRLLSEADPAVTPRRALLVTGGLTSLIAIATLAPTLGRQFDFIIGLTVATLMLTYGLCAAALIVEVRAIRDGVRRWAARGLGVAMVVFCLWVVWTWASTL